MNYYEGIQKAIDYCEENLCGTVKMEALARQACMSLSSFHRMFFSMTGFSAAEYLRNRRISLAAADIRAGAKVLDTAVKYSYESADSFARAFRRATGYLPSKYGQQTYIFERIDLMDKFYDEQDQALFEKYPDIKVLKELPPMRAAYYCYYGKNPEGGAFKVMADWVKRQKFSLDSGSHRIFGYNAPGARPGDEEYGYEVCVTIPEDYAFEDEKVKTKYLTGGKYVVCHVDRGGEIGRNIMEAWQRLNKWISESRYVYDGSVQWLEEHLGFDSDNNHTGGVDLYGAIAPRSSLDSRTEMVEEPDLKVRSFSAKGACCEDQGRKLALDWMAENGLEVQKCKIFAFYDVSKIGTGDFIFNVYVSPDEAHAFLADGTFPGGRFALRKTKYKHNGREWFRFIGDMMKNPCYEPDNCRPFMEVYALAEPRVSGETEIFQYLPVKER